MISTGIESIEFKNVTMAFNDNEVLRNCNFKFPMNQNCRIVFKDDREKFFFFHSLTQIQGFNKGEFLINGINVLDLCFEEFMGFRLKIGFGFSTRGLLHNQTLRQNLELPLKFHKIFLDKELIDWMNICVDYFDMHDELDRRPSEVSTNAQKCTLILRAFICQPEVVFLDNPELLLSTKLQANLLQLIDDHRRLYNLKHVFFSTYDESFSDCLVDQNIILSNKRLNNVEVNKKLRIAL